MLIPAKKLYLVHPFAREKQSTGTGMNFFLVGRLKQFIRP